MCVINFYRYSSSHFSVCCVCNNFRNWYTSERELARACLSNASRKDGMSGERKNQFSARSQEQSAIIFPWEREWNWEFEYFCPMCLGANCERAREWDRQSERREAIDLDIQSAFYWLWKNEKNAVYQTTTTRRMTMTKARGITRDSAFTCAWCNLQLHSKKAFCRTTVGLVARRCECVCWWLQVLSYLLPQKSRRLTLYSARSRASREFKGWLDGVKFINLRGARRRRARLSRELFTPEREKELLSTQCWRMEGMRLGK
jgi:hypothetical protein